MKKPTLEEVKEYFKDAETVHTSGGIVEMNLNNIFCQEQLYWVKFRFGCYIIWSETEVYAKILTYKEPKEETFVITKEQIKSLYSYAGANNQHNLEKWFPKAFEEEKKELVVGKWYVSSSFLINFQEENKCYGFSLSSGSWLINLQHTIAQHEKCEYREATEQEVFDALKKEAVKRGFKEGVYFKDVHTKSEFRLSNLHYENDSNDLRGNIGCVFHGGKWAEIIPTISLKEAEERLNCKII